ncbi:MAG: hypothetical protein GX259_06200 [Bacteroidales bacterium]|nr:hypothetical protein [Bacteroidales bacterium]
MNIKISERIFIILLLISAFILRFYNFSHLSFTIEELDFLMKVNANNFSSLISEGSNISGQSFITQIFLFFYLKLVGFSEIWIKLPFILCGVASVYLVWRIGRELFTPATGMLSATAMAFLQCGILHSQIASPFAIGLLFFLIMILGWSRIIFQNTKRFSYNTTLFALGAILSVYNHSFSFFLTLITIILGFFFINKKILKKYIVTCLIAIILIVPYFFIASKEFISAWTLDWLTIPKYDFFINYTKYIFHFSTLLIIIFALIVVFSIIRSVILKDFYFNKALLAILILGVLPVFIANIYSLKNTETHVYSILLFSLPLILFATFSQFKDAGMRLPLRLSLLWTIALVFTLVSPRGHYKYFYKSIYDESFKEIKAFTQTHKASSTAILCDIDETVADVYTKKHKLSDSVKIEYVNNFSSIADINSYLSNSNFEFIILSRTINSEPWLYPLCHSYFQKILVNKKYFQGDIAIMRKGKESNVDYINQYQCNFSNENKGNWNFDTTLIKTDLSTNTFFIAIDSLYNKNIWTENANEIIFSSANFFDTKALVFIPDSNAKGAISASLKSKEKMLINESVEISSFTTKIGEWTPVCLSISFNDIKSLPKNSTIEINIRNEKNIPFYIKEISAGMRPGNPYIKWETNGILKNYN